jgi:membrane protease YdiL (CAAX protease family)
MDERRPRADWRLGGRTVVDWRARLFAVALISLGLAIIAGALVQWLWPVSSWVAASTTALLWMGMLVPVGWGLSRSRPAGLLGLRPVDALYGIAFGVALRVAQGWVEQAVTGHAMFPAYSLIDGALPTLWWFTDAVAVVAVAPVVEEFYFRGVILITVYTMVRHPFGRTAAGVSAVIASSALFVLLHGLTATPSLDNVFATGLLGLVCAVLVMLTGRIWGAVLVHVAYNATYVLLALVGTFLS